MLVLQHSPFGHQIRTLSPYPSQKPHFLPIHQFFLFEIWHLLFNNAGCVRGRPSRAGTWYLSSSPNTMTSSGAYLKRQPLVAVFRKRKPTWLLLHLSTTPKSHQCKARSYRGHLANETAGMKTRETGLGLDCGPGG